MNNLESISRPLGIDDVGNDYGTLGTGFIESLCRVLFPVGCVGSKSVTHRGSRIQSLMGYARVTVVTPR